MKMKKSLWLAAGLVFLGLLLPLSAGARTITWVAGHNGNYTSSFNWIGGRVPGSNDDAKIDNGNALNSVATLDNANQGVRTLAISSGDTLNIGNSTPDHNTSLQVRSSTGVTNDGLLNIYGSSTYYGMLTTNRNGTSLGGSGTYVLSGAGAEIGGYRSFSLGSSATLRGNGIISVPITNAGDILAGGGDLNVTGAITDSGGTIGTYDSSGNFNYNVAGGGTLTASHVSMAGGSLNSTTGWGFSSLDLSGWGTITRPFNSNGGSITASGGTLQLQGTLTNPNILNVSGTFDNATGAALTFPTINMQGGTLAATSGSFSSNNAISGYGLISAPLTNTGTVTATGAGQTLTVTGAVSGAGDVNVGTTTPGDTATLTLQNNLGAHNLTLNQDGILNVASGNTITLSGNFVNNATNVSQQQPAAGFNLTMTGSGTYEVAGYDYGASNLGFSNNFNLASLSLSSTANIQLVDLVNNGNQGGASGAEALYIAFLSGDAGAVLDLNNQWVYVMGPSGPISLADGVYNNIMITNSPDPVPLCSTLLLLGTGLVGMALLRGRPSI